MSLRHQAERLKPTFAAIENDSRVLLAVSEYSHLLPTHKTAAILDIGFGGGWFMAACNWGTQTSQVLILESRTNPISALGAKTSLRCMKLRVT
jgi:tRNA G46 methylase TrmB